MKLVIEIEDWERPKKDGIRDVMSCSISSELKESPEDGLSMHRDYVNESLAQQVSRYAELKNGIKNLVNGYYQDLNSKRAF